MSDAKTPWAHVGISPNNEWGGVIAHQGYENPTPAQDKSWRKEVAKFCAGFIADGCQGVGCG